MTDRIGKAVERRITTFFNTTRAPLSGQNSKHTGAAREIKNIKNDD